METKIVAFYYLESSGEGSFSENQLPFVLSEIAQEFKLSNYDIFKKCGGLKVSDYFKDIKTHVRMSLWQSVAGYKDWEQHPDNSSYLSARAQYQAENKITASIEGPFETTLHD